MSRQPHTLIKIPNSIKCKVIERVNRFIVKIDLSDSETLAYLQNTGRLREYLKPNKIGFCMPLKNPKKLHYRLFAIKDNDLSALIDTFLQAKGFEKAVERELIPWLRSYRIEGKEVRVDSVRLDYLIGRGSDKAFIELKSGVLRIDDCAAYPDCLSKRAQEQLRAMTKLVRRGERVFLIFVVAIPGVKGFRLNCEVDQELCNLVAEAVDAGVIVKSIQLCYDHKESSIILLNSDLPIKI